MLKKSILSTLIFTMLASLTACRSNTVTSKEFSYQMACGTDLGKSLICTDENLKVEVVEGIKIGGVDGALFANQTVKKNQELQHLIKNILAKDKTALKTLLAFDCGGGAGCYDLGFIFSQLVFKIGENEFIMLISDLSPNEKDELESFLRAGLEYGYGDGVIGLDLTTTFPNLYLSLQKK